MTEKTITLTAWEHQQMTMRAAGSTMEYMAHYGREGLFRREVDEMNRWEALSAKLAGREPDPLPYRGYQRNGFNPDRD